MHADQDHWNRVYATKAETELSWYQSRPERSLAFIASSSRGTTDSIIDIGGGASCLVDELVALGYADITVLDISEVALAQTRSRLGAKAETVSWIVADITRWRPARTWDIWHDRAVFHFLIGRQEQEAYLAALRLATRAGSTVIISCFALDGPERCSGLPVQRYSAATLAARLGAEFELTAESSERHTTPSGGNQSFTYAMLKRR